jgi:hypothetical protein
MEKSPQVSKKINEAELESLVHTSRIFTSNILNVLELCNDVLLDLTWNRGGQLDSATKEYVIALTRITAEILRERRENEI